MSLTKRSVKCFLIRDYCKKSLQQGINLSMPTEQTATMNDTNKDTDHVDLETVCGAL